MESSTLRLLSKRSFVTDLCLYADTCGLNAILMQPFEMPSPASLFDGELVLHYAIRGGVEEEIQQLPPAKKMLYAKLLKGVKSLS